jgi:hypothetical protein
VRRAGAELRLEVFQPEVQNGGLKSVVGRGLEWFEKSVGRRGEEPLPVGGRGFGK